MPAFHHYFWLIQGRGKGALNVKETRTPELDLFPPINSVMVERSQFLAHRLVFKYLNRHFLDVWEINLPELFSVTAKSSGDNVCKISKTMFLEKQFLRIYVNTTETSKNSIIAYWHVCGHH